MTIRFAEMTFAHVAELEDNFGDSVPHTQRLPGRDGGWSHDGDLPAPTAIGTVTLGCWLVAPTRATMDAQRDAVLALSALGLQRLTVQPTDPASPERTCWARVNYVRLTERKDAHTDLWQKVQIVFQVPDPHWYAVAYGVDWQVGGGVLLGQADLTLGRGAYVINASGTLTTASLTHLGNTTALATFAVQPPAGQTCDLPRLQRVVDGQVVDEVVYNGTLSAGDEWVVDGRRGLVTLNGASAFGASLRYLHPSFLRLAAGVNSVQVRFANPTDAATVRVWFDHTYR